MQQYNSKIVKYTIQFVHTWILKDEQVATYIAPEKIIVQLGHKIVVAYNDAIYTYGLQLQ